MAKAPMSGAKRKLSAKELYNKIGILIIMAVLIVLFSTINPIFIRPVNLLNILTQTACIIIVGCGITPILITGNTDLAAGSMVAFSGCVSIGTFKNLTEKSGFGDVPAAICAILLGILACVVIYTIGAQIITKLGAPAFIVTLGINTAARGMALLYTKAKIIKQIGNIVVLGQGKIIGGFSYPILITIIFVLLTWVLLTKTRQGKYIYAVGGNMESAKAAGINTSWVITKVYLFHSVCVAVAGTVFMARLNSAQPAEAVGMEFDAITGAIIGGASLAGGQGNIFGTVVGCLIVGMIANILNLMHVQSYYQQIITGLVIVAAVVVDTITKSGKKR